MKGKHENVGARQPWYSPNQPDRSVLVKKIEDAARSARDLTDARTGWFSGLLRVLDGLTALGAGMVAGVLYCGAVLYQGPESVRLLCGGLAILSTGIAIFFLLRQIGQVFRALTPVAPSQQTGHGGGALATASGGQASQPDWESPSLAVLGLQVLRGSILPTDARKTLPAPEMVLHQFVLQVKAYANERSYQKTKNLQTTEKRYPGSPEPVDLLKRRWNEVLDSLNEFEIYLAGDQRSMIDKLVARHPSTLLDVSQIFREVAESFDTTWRRKGINIESAIVTPLKATTSEPILRRILVGPWRTSAYLARRGNGVVFSAQSQDGKVVARWECEGVSVPEEYLAIALDQSRTVNERIEIGMEQLSGDSQNSNVLFALVSLITWIDLATACETKFEFKNTNDGFVISLQLD
jgi:hypothetical protein